MLTNDYALTAMVLWELFLEPVNLPPRKQSVFLTWVQNYRDTNGTADTRDQILALAKPCQDLSDIMYGEGEFDESFDWEFCPRWLEHCVDWSNDWSVKPNAREIMKRLWAEMQP